MLYIDFMYTKYENCYKPILSSLKYENPIRFYLTNYKLDIKLYYN